MKNDKINLEYLEIHLTKCLVKLDHEFLKKLFQNASKSENPYSDRYFVERIGLTYNMNARMSVGLYTLFRKNRFIEFKTLQKLRDFSNYDWTYIQKNLLCIRACRHGGEIKTSFPIEINKPLGLIAGYIMGDGSIDKKYSQVFFTNKDKNLILEFYNSMRLVFNVEPMIWLQKSGKFKTKSKWIRRINSIKQIPSNSQIGLFYPSICGIILNSIFNNFAVGKKKRITEKIMKTNRDFKISFIRAFFDDERHMDKKKVSRFHQDNKLILENIKKLLIELEIHSFPVRTYFRREKNRYFFNINRRENYKKYYEIIGCTSRKN